MIEIDNTGIDELKKIEEKIDKIKDQNKLIENFFKEIVDYKNVCIDNNKEVIRNLEIHLIRLKNKLEKLFKPSPRKLALEKLKTF